MLSACTQLYNNHTIYSVLQYNAVIHNIEWQYTLSNSGFLCSIVK